MGKTSGRSLKRSEQPPGGGKQQKNRKTTRPRGVNHQKEEERRYLGDLEHKKTKGGKRKGGKAERPTRDKPVPPLHGGRNLPGVRKRTKSQNQRHKRPVDSKNEKRYRETSIPGASGRGKKRLGGGRRRRMMRAYGARDKAEILRGGKACPGNQGVAEGGKKDGLLEPVHY